MISARERLREFRASHCFYRYVPIPFTIAYLSTLKALGGLGLEHFILGGLFIGFSTWSDTSRRWAKVVLPVLLYATVYDSMRWYADYIRSPVIHLHEPHDFDVRFFGIQSGDKVLTPSEWWQLHTVPALDFICGLAYFVAFFVGESILIALYLFWRGDEKRALRFIWVFVVTNFMGFALYYIYPAAPPWYISDHGYVVDLSVRASGAGALRFDEIIGLPLMHGFYGKSADVFGAVPSLHVAYPFLAAIYSWPLKRLRFVTVPYFLLVCFSAVYLNHHYMLDILVGLGVCCCSMALFRFARGPIADKVGDESKQQRQFPSPEARI